MASKHRITVGEEFRYDSDLQGLKSLSGTYARSDALDIRTKGAVSGQDCTAAIDAARAESTNLYFPEGNWIYNGTGLDWTNLIIRGSGKGKTTITLGTNKVLVTGSGPSALFRMSHAKIQGGFGAVRLTGASASVGVGGERIIENCDFINYTGAAFSEKFTDCPGWTFRSCGFFAANEATTFGIVLTGDVAGARIEGCGFARNRAHIKVGPGLGGNFLSVIGCDFIRNDAYTGTGRHDIWILPTNPSGASSQGPLLDDNKFGPENRGALDCAILIAEQNSGDNDPATSQPDLTTVSANEVRSLRIPTALVGTNNSLTKFIYSTTPALPLLSVGPIVMYGSPPNYLIEYLDPSGVAAAVGAEQGTISGLVNKDAGRNGVVELSNSSFPPAVVVNDPLRTISNVSADGEQIGYVNTLNTSPTSAVALGGSTTASATTDARGGTDAVALVGTTSLYAYGVVSNTVVGQRNWVELDLAPPLTGSPPSTVTLQVRVGSGAVDFQHTIRMPSSWRRYQFSYIVRDATADQVVISSASANVALRVGRLRSYMSPVPLGHGLDAAYIRAVAPPTGVAAADDANILAAYNRLPATGGTLVFQAGTYATAGDVLTFPKQVRIVGAGSGTGVAGSNAGGTVISCASATKTAVKLNSPGSSISEVAITNSGYITGGTPVTPTAGAGLSVLASSGCLVERVLIQGFYDNLVFDQSYYLGIRDCRILDCVRYGLYFRNTTSTDEGDWLVEGCTFTPWSKSASPTAAVRHESGGGLRFIGNKINGGPNTDHPSAGKFANGVQCLMADGVTTADVQIVGNSIENINTDGYSVDVNRLNSTGNLSGVVISGNEFGYSSAYGIRIGPNISNVTIDGNVFQQLTQNDIYLEGGSGIRIGSNVHQSTTTGTARVRIGNNTNNVTMDPPIRVADGILYQDDTGSNAVAGIHNRFAGPIPAVATTTPVVVARLAVGQFNGGTLDFCLGGSASSVGAFAYRFSRSFNRVTGAVTVATIGSDHSSGAGAAEVTVTFDTAAVSGEVQVKIAAANSHALYGRYDLTVMGQLSSYRQGA